MPENNLPKPPEKPWRQVSDSLQPYTRHNCSFHICENGHGWPAQLATPHCQGCQTPILALRMVNCPICNEPATGTVLRIDYLAGSHPITKVCKEEYHIGPEYIFVEIDHTHTRWTQTSAQPTAPETKNVAVSPFRLAGPPEDAPAEGSTSELDGCVRQNPADIQP